MRLRFLEHVTAASQENAAGIREIEKMVRQIDELARTLQTGLASEEKVSKIDKI